MKITSNQPGPLPCLSSPAMKITAESVYARDKGFQTALHFWADGGDGPTITVISDCPSPLTRGAALTKLMDALVAPGFTIPPPPDDGGDNRHELYTFFTLMSFRYRQMSQVSGDLAAAFVRGDLSPNAFSDETVVDIDNGDPD